MFIGHFGLAFGVKKTEPTVALPVLFAATQFADILWPLFLLLGIEKFTVVPGFTAATPIDFVYYPFSHSLGMDLIWGLLFGSIYWLITKNARAGVIVGLCVLSHWFLDLLMHVKDLPVFFGETKFGLGAWNSVPLTLAIEGIFFGAGVYYYVSSTKAVSGAGKWGLWTLLIILVVVELGNIFGPPPEGSVASLFVSFNVLLIILFALAWWVDKKRASADS